MKNLSYSLSLLICLTISCDKTNPVKDTIPIENLTVIAEMTNDFGWRLFQEVAKGELEKNVLISPLSVQVALSMAANGADGMTLKEMLTVMGCIDCDVKDLNTQTAQLRILMEEQSGHPRLISANGFFYDPDRIQVYESFQQTLIADYKAGFQKYNFSDPATADKINDWVKENTGDKIDKIIEEIDAYDLAFLINALHFKADWATGFDPEGTYSGMFTTAANTEKTVSFMEGDHNFSTVKGPQFNMVDLPFKDSSYTLSLVQPKDQSPIQSDWALQLTPTELKNMWNTLTYDRAFVTFPRFEIAYDKELVEPLKQMGIHDAFSDSGADFSNLGQALIGPVIFISKVRHKAVLKIDEKGAEGAAVTSVGFSTTSAPPSFTFNRPFVIVLRHTQTNTILFAGLINDPS